jgi:hypothetical protein
MRTLESETRQSRQVSCVACATHMHPEMVPWLQHEIGCAVRLAALSRYHASASPQAGRVATGSASSRL